MAKKKGKNKTGQFTIRQVRFAAHLADSKSLKEAARKAGYSETTSGTDILKSIKGKEQLQDALLAAGIDNDYIAKLYTEVLRTGRDSDRLKALDMLHKIMGEYAPQKMESTKTVKFEDAILRSAKEIEAEHGDVEIGEFEEVME